MFLPTHMAVGAIIDKATGGGWKRRIFLVAPLAFASHALLDFFNCGPHTLYHEVSGPLLTGLVVSVSIVFVALLLWKAHRYWWGMLFAALPDLEWVVFGIAEKMGNESIKLSGLHHNLFWPSCLATEWGLLAQAVLLLMLYLVVIRKEK